MFDKIYLKKLYFYISHNFFIQYKLCSAFSIHSNIIYYPRMQILFSFISFCALKYCRTKKKKFWNQNSIRYRMRGWENLFYCCSLLTLPQESVFYFYNIFCIKFKKKMLTISKKAVLTTKLSWFRFLFGTLKMNKSYIW